MLQLLELIERPLRGLQVGSTLAIMVCFDVSSVISCFRAALSRSNCTFDTCYSPSPQTFHYSSLRRYLGMWKIQMSRLFPPTGNIFLLIQQFPSRNFSLKWCGIISFSTRAEIYLILIFKEPELLDIKTTEAKHLRQSYIFTIVYSEVPEMTVSINGIKGEITDALIIPINFAKPVNIWNRTQ